MVTIAREKAEAAWRAVTHDGATNVERPSAPRLIHVPPQPVASPRANISAHAASNYDKRFRERRHGRR